MISHSALATLKLWIIPRVGPRTIARIYENTSHYKDIASMGYNDIISTFQIKKKEKYNLAALERNFEKELTIIQTQNVKVIDFQDENYPPLLQQISSRPPLIYYKGDLDIFNNFTLAVVGTRKASYYAKEQTKKIISDCLQYPCECTIVSGLAYGIDKVAHETALDNNIKTAAILAGGLNHIYPESHIPLADRIVQESGVLLSEAPYFTKPIPSLFPLRNRIISGLSKACLVMEASEKSGSLITAKFALEQNREIFALPGQINNNSFLGCNKLIQQGAKILLDSKDIFNEFPHLQLQKISTQQIAKPQYSLTQEEKKILHLLKNKNLHSEEIASHMDIPYGQLLSFLTQMQSNNLIYEENDGYFGIINS